MPEYISQSSRVSSGVPQGSASFKLRNESPSSPQAIARRLEMKPKSPMGSMTPQKPTKATPIKPFHEEQEKPLLLIHSMQEDCKPDVKRTKGPFDSIPKHTETQKASSPWSQMVKSNLSWTKANPSGLSKASSINVGPASLSKHSRRSGSMSIQGSSNYASSFQGTMKPQDNLSGFEPLPKLENLERALEGSKNRMEAEKRTNLFFDNEKGTPLAKASGLFSVGRSYKRVMTPQVKNGRIAVEWEPDAESHDIEPPKPQWISNSVFLGNNKGEDFSAKANGRQSHLQGKHSEASSLHSFEASNFKSMMMSASQNIDKKLTSKVTSNYNKRSKCQCHGVYDNSKTCPMALSIFFKKYGMDGHQKMKEILGRLGFVELPIETKGKIARMTWETFGSHQYFQDYESQEQFKFLLVALWGYFKNVGGLVPSLNFFVGAMHYHAEPLHAFWLAVDLIDTLKLTQFLTNSQATLSFHAGKVENLLFSASEELYRKFVLSNLKTSLFTGDWLRSALFPIVSFEKQVLFFFH